MEGKKEHNPVRVRYAPSPTGPLNLGTLRTALFNWVFAKQNEGTFVLRIEDTDRERSKKEYEEEIQQGLNWIGLTWDEFYRQSDRLEHYTEALKELMDKNKAYYCFCTPEELETERQAQLTQGLPPKYGGKCRGIPVEEAKKRAETEKSVIRFHMPEREISFSDFIRGQVTFDTSLMGDIVIAKNLEEPLYNFAVVIDDADMRISHVIRGEDHISNTPKQIAIRETLGLPEVTYAHLPLILGPDKKKLSKRYLATSISEYRTQGYLPEAIINFLALLGWHPTEDNEFFSFKELLEKFSFDRVQKSGAIFNAEKLDWFNAHYIRNLKEEELSHRLLPFIPESWLTPRERFQKVIRTVQDRLRKLSEFPSLAEFFFLEPEYEKSLLVWKDSSPEEAKENLKRTKEILEDLTTNEFELKELEGILMSLADERGRGAVLWPLRVALSGQPASPGPFEILDALGKEESIRRIEHALSLLEQTEKDS